MPTQNQVHVDKLLTNVSVAFAQSPNAFVASRVFPPVPVAHQSDKYLIVDRGEFNRDEMQLRADATESAGGSFKYSDDSYFCDVWALHKDLGDQTVANAENIFQLRSNTTEYLARQAMIRKEKLFVESYFSASVWTSDLDGIAGAPGAGQFRQWDDYVNSDPITDIRKESTSQQILTGFRPNILVMGRQVWDALLDHPDIIDRIKYGTTDDNVAIANQRTLARLFEVEEILVMNAIENTAAEGLTDVNAFIGGKQALLCYRTATPGTMTPTAGYTFSWSGLSGSFGGLGTRVKSFRMDHLEAERIEIEMAFDMKVVSADMGSLFLTAVS